MAEWSKALVLGTSLFGGVGSNPTPVTDVWGISSIGRVRRSQRRGTGIEPGTYRVLGGRHNQLDHRSTTASSEGLEPPISRFVVSRLIH